MQRIRFLTAMAVGAFVTEGLEDDPRRRDASPYLIWEWLVVESLIRISGDDPTLWGVPGTQVTRRALDQHGSLDARSYLKTPRIFGFHGVYKRLANHLGIVDVHLGLGPNAEPLVDAWARGWVSATEQAPDRCCCGGEMPFDAAKQSDRHGRSPAGGQQRGRSWHRHSAPPEVRDGSNVAYATSCSRRRTVGWGRCRHCGSFKRNSRTTDSRRSCCTTSLRRGRQSMARC